MPTLETPEGKPVEVTPADAEAINAKFGAVMNDDGPDPAAIPKRAARGPADGTARPRTAGRQPKAEKSRTTAAAAKGPLTRAQRTEGAKGLFQVGAALALIGGKATGSTAFTADSLTISGAADEGARVLADTAAQDEGFAAALDKLCAVGPWGALIGFGFSLGGQLVRNHVPSLSVPGTVHPDELIRQATAAQAAAVPQAA